MPDQLPRTVLVTGATGFVGRHVCRHLAEAGVHVVALARSTSRLEPVRPWLHAVRIADLARPETLVGVAEGIDAIVHTACAVASTFDAGRDAEAAFFRVNRDGTRNLALEALRHPGVRFVHTSSTAAMGAPRTEEVDEDAPCDPRTPYQRSKRAAEEALLALHAEQGLDVVMLRPCVTAGAGKDRSELLQLFRMLRHGVFPLLRGAEHAHKPLIHVEDLARTLVDATHRGRAGGIYFVHSDGGHTLGGIVETATRLLRERGVATSPSPLPAGALRLPVGPIRVAAHAFVALGRVAPAWNPPVTPERVDLFLRDRRIRIDRARADLGFDPRVRDLDTLLGDTLDYHVARGHLPAAR